MRFALLVAVLFAACAPTTPPVNGPPGATAAQGSGAGSGSNVVCHEETPTGSSISRTVCQQVDPFNKVDEPGVMNSMQGPQGNQMPGQNH
jgi:hypothetical protein